jgi:hypothetical protein
MIVGNIQGRARTSRTSPKGKGECDRCGIWYQLDALRRQMQWSGSKLIDTGFLVCSHCLDTPQQQFRSIILPADPYPLPNPRPGKDAAAAASGGSNDRVSSTGYVSDTSTYASGT